METEIRFLCEDFEIEGLLSRDDSDKGVVISHPHPLYGGDMHNNVVSAIQRAFRNKGYTTLRFNFRGVGDSGGRYAKGIGEQKDVQSALSFLEEMGIENIHLAGYSFGAWVNALAMQEIAHLAGMVMVSPPVAAIDFQPITRIPALKLVITGSRDEFAPGDVIEELLPSWNPDVHFEVVNGADHFYIRHTDRLEEILSSYI